MNDNVALKLLHVKNKQLQSSSGKKTEDSEGLTSRLTEIKPISNSSSAPLRLVFIFPFG